MYLFVLIGDGSTTFNVPDLREAVPVGVGTRGGITRHDVYALGDYKEDQLLTHGHSVTDPDPGHGHKHWQADGGGNLPNPNPEEIELKTGTAVWSVYPAASSFSYSMARGYTGISVGAPNGTAPQGNVNRGKRLGMNYIIKY